MPPEATEKREEIAAARVQSPAFEEIRVALDPSGLARLREEEQAQKRPRPVLTLEDVARLREKSPEAIQAVLRVAAVFPGARLIQ